MTTTEFTEKLHDLLDLDGLEPDFLEQIVSFRTFDEVGIRYNDGLVVRMADGTEFQITIVRSN